MVSQRLIPQAIAAELRGRAESQIATLEVQGSAQRLLYLAAAKGAVTPVQRREWNLIRGLFVIYYGR